MNLEERDEDKERTGTRTVGRGLTEAIDDAGTEESAEEMLEGEEALELRGEVLEDFGREEVRDDWEPRSLVLEDCAEEIFDASDEPCSALEDEGTAEPSPAAA